MYFRLMLGVYICIFPFKVRCMYISLCFIDAMFEEDIDASVDQSVAPVTTIFQFILNKLGKLNMSVRVNYKLLKQNRCFSLFGF